MFRNIVVGVDGSEQSDLAIRLACDLALKYDGKIHLVNAPELGTVELAMGAGAYSIPPSDAHVEAAGKKIMEEAVEVAKDSGIKAESTTIGRGTPSKEVLAAAETTGADLIVTGRRGLGGIAGTLMGSTSQKIAHNAKCALLTVA